MAAEVAPKSFRPCVVGRQFCIVDEVRPQLNELLFWSVKNVAVESVDVADTLIPAEARATSGQAARPDCGC
ncbi:hypothetical protein SNE510_73120 [Streptomyces sp. NE5-10]|uniref:hypothetical protein n=1 Tax=Streptomyces sp. NE5-10 TaxID=2759674 RepID=UPI001908F0BF|nr:hypothetical protein [Streptomyces sp. NE5-10]GHJ97793.1 hypothetical protein SNE510_73120 [Streptomyces sp. NE5-10]